MFLNFFQKYVLKKTLHCRYCEYTYDTSSYKANWESIMSHMKAWHLTDERMLKDSGRNLSIAGGIGIAIVYVLYRVLYT